MRALNAKDDSRHPSAPAASQNGSQTPKSPPSDTEAEVSVLSGILQFPEWIPKLRAEGLTRDLFTAPQNKDWLDAIVARHDRKEPIDPILVWNDLQWSDRQEWVRVATAEPTAHLLPQYLAVLREKHALRTLLQAADDITAHAEGRTKPDDIIRDARQAIEAAERINQGKRRSKTLKEILSDWFEDYTDKITSNRAGRIPTGLRQLDATLGGGLTTGGLTVICGSTGAGKTALALQIYVDATLRGLKTIIASLEMLESECVERMIANLAEINVETLANPAEYRPTKDNLDAIRRAAKQLAQANARITDHSTSSLPSLLDELETIRQQDGLDIVIVDYIQLVEGVRLKGENREREVAGISKALHQFGLQNNLVVIAMSQLNDTGALRESRAIGQDAKTVLKVEDEGIRILKNRQGPGRDSLVPLVLDGSIQQFKPSDQPYNYAHSH